MTNIRNSILATIIYYDSFNFPLTLAEVYKYLINPHKFLVKENDEFAVSALAVVEELDKLAKAGTIGHKNGFYFMPGKDGLYETRIEKDKLASKKWKKFLRIAKYLQVSPYLRAVFASGSLAANNPEPKSDFDVFVIIKSGRLYTGRFFLWLISSILGVRRGRFDILAPDKLCFNHYLTDDNLGLSHRSLYIAQSVANMRPVIFREGILDRFTASNKWVNAHCYNFKQINEYRNVKGSGTLQKRYLTPFIVGDLIEKILKSIQQKRIKKNPATYESGGRIIFTDRELEFHPRSFERVVIDNYNRGIKKLGILNAEEEDSGLN